MSEIQLDYLRSRLVEADLSQEEKFKESFAENMTCKAHGCASDKLSESEAILVIKQLQEKVFFFLVFHFFSFLFCTCAVLDLLLAKLNMDFLLFSVNLFLSADHNVRDVEIIKPTKFGLCY